MNLPKQFADRRNNLAKDYEQTNWNCGLEFPYMHGYEQGFTDALEDFNQVIEWLDKHLNSDVSAASLKHAIRYHLNRFKDKYSETLKN